MQLERSPGSFEELHCMKCFGPNNSLAEGFPNSPCPTWLWPLPPSQALLPPPPTLARGSQHQHTSDEAPSQALSPCPVLHTGHKGQQCCHLSALHKKKHQPYMDLTRCPPLSGRPFPVTPKGSFVQFWAVYKGWQRLEATSSSNCKSQSLQKTQCKYSLVKNSGSNRAEPEIPE